MYYRILQCGSRSIMVSSVSPIIKKTQTKIPDFAEGQNFYDMRGIQLANSILEPAEVESMQKNESVGWSDMFNRGKTKAKSAQHSDAARESSSGKQLSTGIPTTENFQDGLSLGTSFEVYLLGVVKDINMGISRKRDKEAQLVDQVEEAQVHGKLPTAPREEDKVNIYISKHGLKVLNSTKKEVLHRHPLHTIAQVVHYDDGFGKPNIAFKLGQLQHSMDTSVYQCFVFQCPNEDLAQAICQSVRNIFNAITGQ